MGKEWAKATEGYKLLTLWALITLAYLPPLIAVYTSASPKSPRMEFITATNHIWTVKSRGKMIAVKRIAWQCDSAISKTQRLVIRPVELLLDLRRTPEYRKAEASLQF